MSCFDKINWSYLEYRKSEKVNKDNYEELYLNHYVPDKRLLHLADLLTEQYKLVEDMSQRQSMLSWRRFYDINLESYSKEEIKQVRKILQQRGVDYD